MSHRAIRPDPYRRQVSDVATATHAGLFCAILMIAPLSSVHAGDGAERSAVETVRAKTACLTESMRATGFVVAHDERLAGLQLPGYRVSDVLVTEGDAVQANQELFRAIPLTASGDSTESRAPVSVRAPIAGLVTEVSAIVGETTGNPAAADRPRVAISAGPASISSLTCRASTRRDSTRVPAFISAPWTAPRLTGS